MKNIENDEIRDILEEISKIAGCSWNSEINNNHFGSVNFGDVIELLKIVELRKLNDNLENIYENLGGRNGDLNERLEEIRTVIAWKS